MDTRKRKKPVNISLYPSAENKSPRLLMRADELPSVDDALCLDELIYSRETQLLAANKYIHADDFYDAYDVLSYFIAEPVQLDIIKEIIEGLNQLYKNTDVRDLFKSKLLSPKEILDRFLYVRSDNDYEFNVTVNEVSKLAALLSSPAATALINHGSLKCRNVIEDFLACSENQFDFNNALAARRESKSSKTNPNHLFHHIAAPTAHDNTENTAPDLTQRHNMA